jgi:aspartyl-tRNA(Asn)/glutamyl-tRNA(Gln) amidotransferase subunit B
VAQTLRENPELLASYRGGKLTVEKALMGKAMAITRGKANPERMAELLRAALADDR